MRTTCVGASGEQKGSGSLELAADALSFAGPFELRVPVGEITTVSAHRGVLEIIWPGGEASFSLGGGEAQDWARLIRGPRQLLDRLGVKPEARVLVLGVDDLDFHRQLRQRTSQVLTSEEASAQGQLDVIFLGAAGQADLAQIPTLERLLAPTGALWVVHADTPGAVSKLDAVRAGSGAGLSEVKTVQFSGTQSAHKFVIPVAKR